MYCFQACVCMYCVCTDQPVKYRPTGWDSERVTAKELSNYRGLQQYCLKIVASVAYPQGQEACGVEKLQVGLQLIDLHVLHDGLRVLVLRVHHPKPRQVDVVVAEILHIDALDVLSGI